ncbi:MAG: DUF2442 domain-containing protein [Chloroflexi bacterium]|nr:MAG: DUF2442 domain-containing protein [Chloroflexota bacterium]
MSIATIETQPRVAHVGFGRDKLLVEIADGRTVSVPLEWYPRLLHATAAERTDWRVMEDSDGRDIIFWEQLDEMIPAVALLSGVKSRESQRSLDRWLADRLDEAQMDEINALIAERIRGPLKVDILGAEFRRKMKEAGITLEDLLDGLDEIREERWRERNR